MKRFVLAVLALMLAMALAVPAFAEGAAMEAVNVVWDLEENTPVTCRVRFTGTDEYYPVEYRITGMKDTVAGDGTRKITFIVNFTNKFNPSKDEVTAIAGANVNGEIGGTMAWTLVDYDTGLNIEEVNRVGLTEDAVEKTYNTRKFYGSNGAYIEVPVTIVYQVTITCPKDYDGLCIGVLGQVNAVPTQKDMAFWEGKVPFSETSYFSAEDDQLTHFMRVRAAGEE